MFQGVKVITDPSGNTEVYFKVGNIISGASPSQSEDLFNIIADMAYRKGLQDGRDTGFPKEKVGVYRKADPYPFESRITEKIPPIE